MKKYKHIHKNDAALPPIELNLSSDKNAELSTQIFVDCKEKISGAGLERLRKRLRMIHPEELFHLNGVRIVSPSALKLGTHEPTQGCYQQATNEQRAEVWISSELFRFSSKIVSFFDWLLLNDRLLEVLYHEIGHHKAVNTPMVSRHKHEAYAEKFMLAYKTVWMKNHGPSRLTRKIAKWLYLAIMFPVVFVWHCIKPKDPMSKIFFQRLTGRISREEYLKQFNSIFHGEDWNKKRKKWTHPLEKTKYRKKFHIDM